MTDDKIAHAKPCPFCGKPANCVQGRVRIDLLNRIGCGSCGYWCEFDSVEMALAWWNYREKRKGIADARAEACLRAAMREEDTL